MTSLTSVEETLTELEPKQDLDELLTALVKLGGSDLHITAGIAPCMRVNGALEPVPGRAKLLPADTEAFMRAILTDTQWERFLTHSELDTAYALPGVSR